MNITINEKQFKKSVAKTKNFLKENGVVVKHSLLLEGLSVFLGYKNWNTVNSLLKKENSIKSISEVCYLLYVEKNRGLSHLGVVAVSFIETMISLICYLNEKHNTSISEIDIDKDISISNFMAIMHNGEAFSKKTVGGQETLDIIDIPFEIKEQVIFLNNINIPIKIKEDASRNLQQACYDVSRLELLNQEINKQFGYIKQEIIKILK